MDSQCVVTQQCGHGKTRDQDVRRVPLDVCLAFAPVNNVALRKTEEIEQEIQL